MRIVAVIGGLLILGGCASQPEAVSPQQLDAQYRPAVAGALAFDPPILAGEPMLDLSRDGRDVQAFAGFEGPSTTYYDIRVEDRQVEPGWQPSHGRGWDSGDRYERNAISERVGVNYR